jgi:hypothetical protein
LLGGVDFRGGGQYLELKVVMTKDASKAYLSQVSKDELFGEIEVGS